MKCAADFRQTARNALHGKWPTAILTGLLASLMGAGIATGGGGSSSSSSDSSSSDALIQELQASELWMYLQNILIATVVILLVVGIALIVISGAAKLGYAIFNLKLIDGREISVSDLFSQFHRLGAGFCMNFLVGLFTSLWSLLFVIPGIIKQYSYAMTPYILAEHPNMTANEAITESRRIMNGNKWRLFCLGFSFIGWELLCLAPIVLSLLAVYVCIIVTENIAVLLLLIPCCILSFAGSLFLHPYREAAYAAFYRDITEIPGQYPAE